MCSAAGWDEGTAEFSRMSRNKGYSLPMETNIAFPHSRPLHPRAARESPLQDFGGGLALNGSVKPQQFKHHGDLAELDWGANTEYVYLVCDNDRRLTYVA